MPDGDDDWRYRTPGETIEDQLRGIERQLDAIEDKLDKINRDLFALGLAVLFFVFQMAGVFEAVKRWFY